MTHIDLLLPFSLPPPSMAKDLLRAIEAPSLAQLLGRASAAPAIEFDDFARCLPHERWLGERFGLPATEDSSPPVACAAMSALGLGADAGVWFMLQPVHYHIARDHLVLTDTRRLALANEESHSLFVLAKTSFDAAGMTLVYGSAGLWFLRADRWAELQTATPDAACGHNIDIWMPKGAEARAWRKLQNEVQMDWHECPVNAARALRGQEPVNSLWLWGGATADSRSVNGCTGCAGLSGWSRALAPSTSRNIAELIESATARGLAMTDVLAEAALAGDWSEWLARLHALESDCFTPLLAALRGGWLDRLTMVMSHNTRLAEFTVSPRDLHKFWRKPSVARLAA